VLPVSVGYGSDPDRVEAVLTEEVAAAREEPASPSPSRPRRRFRFGAYALEFSSSVSMELRSVSVQHELRKRILRRLARRIEIPRRCGRSSCGSRLPGAGTAVPVTADAVTRVASCGVGEAAAFHHLGERPR
jgi:hypothetical protein